MGFFDKLKGGMGIEEPSATKIEEKKDKPKKVKSRIKIQAKIKPESKPEPKSEPESTTPKIKFSKFELKKEGSEVEGELAIDVYETDKDIVIQSTIGGIKPEELDISIENDLVTIRGSREHLVEETDKNYIYQECYWGSFSRKVILPEEVDESKAKAIMKNSTLTLIMPKLHRKKMKKVTVKPEEE